MKTAKEVLKAIKDNDVKYVDLRFTDPRGKWQHVTFDQTLIDDEAFSDGLMFDGSSIAGWRAINESDMTLMPDPASACMDPFFAASTMVAGIGTFFALASFSSTRALLAKIVPQPGAGPSKEARDAGFFEVKLVGRPDADRDAPKLVGTVRGTSDPGYGETAKMLGESAVCLAKDDLSATGGVLTPASSMGLRLVERLRRAGMTFEVDP